MSSICTRLGLVGPALAACRNLENTVLTPSNINSIVDNAIRTTPNLLVGIPETITDRILSIVKNAILLQQIPWVIGFIIILIVLTVTKIITPLTAIIIGFIVLILIVIFAHIIVNTMKNTVNSTISDVKARFLQNWNSNRDRILT